jgi:hypothetical protein
MPGPVIVLSVLVKRTITAVFRRSGGKLWRLTLRAGMVLDLADEPDKGRWATRVRVRGLGRADLPNYAFLRVTNRRAGRLVISWQTSESAAEAADRLGLPVAYTRSLAAYFKGLGVPLKSHRPGPVPETAGRTPGEAADATLQLMLGLARTRRP